MRRIASLLLIAATAASLAACGGGGGEKLGERVIPLGQPVPKGGGRYAVGEPYQINGVWYRPDEDSAYDKVGVASWYGEMFHGRRTANGEIYDMERLSAASPTLPMPVYARVTNLANGRSIVVRVNDRGPYRSNRVMDVSRHAAEVLGFREAGTTQVRVQYLRPAPLNGDDSYERRYLASAPWAQTAARNSFRAQDPVAVGSLDSDRGLGRARAAASGTGLPLAAEEALEAEQRPPRRRTASAAQGPQSPVAAVGPSPPAPGPARSGGLLIQAGSFKSRDNADRAKSLLGGIASVEVAPVESDGATIFRVRVGPFAGQSEAEAALARVNEAGYAGARIVTN